MIRQIGRAAFSPRPLLRKALVSYGRPALASRSHFRFNSQSTKTESHQTHAPTQDTTSTQEAKATTGAATGGTSGSSEATTATLKTDAPQLMIAFTCKKCDHRSSHVFSKQAYTKGSVLIQCPGCKNRHLIADNLNMFRDNKVNLEDLLAAQGESVATTTADLAFEDIPESLRGVLGPHAKDAPEEYRREEKDGQNLLN